jgi:hypothetical protein
MLVGPFTAMVIVLMSPTIISLFRHKTCHEHCVTLLATALLTLLVVSLVSRYMEVQRVNNACQGQLRYNYH